MAGRFVKLYNPTPTLVSELLRALR
jgi:hypothetical protein